MSTHWRMESSPTGSSQTGPQHSHPDGSWGTGTLAECELERSWEREALKNPAPSLDAAWARVEAALPEGWCLVGVEREFGRPDEGGMPLGSFVAKAEGPRDLTYQYGPTPAAALDALADELEKRT